MNQDNKEINPELFNYKQSRLDKLRAWINEHDPLPYSWGFWYDRQDWLHPSRILRKISNIIRWIPVLYDDVDWDYSGIYRLLQFKIKKMRKHQLSHGNHVDCEEVAEQMKTVEDALSRLASDDYIADAWEAHRNQFPRKKLIDLPNGMKQMPSMSEDERASFNELVKNEEIAWQADMAIVGASLRDHIRGWWD